MSIHPQVSASLGRAGQELYAAHHADHNFTGCGVGYRRRGGVVTDEPVVIAMVIRKRPEASIPRSRLLPRTVDAGGRTWGVDVVEAGPVTAAAAGSVRLGGDRVASNPLPAQFVRPIALGCSISNANGGDTGTLGCFATDSSGTYCMLSSAHVLTRYGAAKAGEAIIQPGTEDGGITVEGVAFLTQWASPLDSATTFADAAVAELADQVDYNTSGVGNLMPAISASHPAVGMVVADDSSACGTNSFLTRMDRTLSQLGMTLVGTGDPLSLVVAPEVGMAIEKVGRTTGYSSTLVDATGVQVKVNYNGTIVTMSDLIWTQAMTNDGDSGAVACLGGDGATYAQLPLQCLVGNPCGLIQAFATYYDLPLTTSANTSLADQVRDHFLAMSTTGQLLIGVTYLNAQTGIDRLNASTGAAHNQSVATVLAQSLYTRYHDLAARVIASSSPSAVITASEINAAASVLYGLAAPVSAGGTAMLTPQESAAAWTLFSGLVKPTIGMGREQVVAYMNEATVFNKVHSVLGTVPTIRLTGAISDA